jgi:hypothetical protein
MPSQVKNITVILNFYFLFFYFFQVLASSGLRGLFFFFPRPLLGGDKGGMGRTDFCEINDSKVKHTHLLGIT